MGECECSLTERGAGAGADERGNTLRHPPLETNGTRDDDEPREPPLSLDLIDAAVFLGFGATGGAANPNPPMTMVSLPLAGAWPAGRMTDSPSQADATDAAWAARASRALVPVVPVLRRAMTPRTRMMGWVGVRCIDHSCVERTDRERVGEQERELPGYPRCSRCGRAVSSQAGVTSWSISKRGGGGMCSNKLQAVHTSSSSEQCPQGR